MALVLSRELRNGAVGEYHRIAELSHVNGTRTAVVRVQLWKNHDTRLEDNRMPMDEQVYHLNLVDEGGADLLYRCYETLKLSTDFIGAVDG